MAALNERGAALYDGIGVDRAMEHFRLGTEQITRERRDEFEELSLVMRETADAMSGIGAALTIHPDGQPARVFYSDEGGGVPRAFVEQLLTSGELCPTDQHGVQHAWLTHDLNGRPGVALCVGVQRVPDHSKLALTVFFEELSNERRAEVLAVYTARRPFAIGYFRLWQANRANIRQIRATEAALSLIDLGIILISGTGKVVFANTAARALLDEGSCIRERNHQVRAATLSDTVRLQSAISHVLQASVEPQKLSQSPLLALQRNGMPPLVVSVLPMTHGVDEASDVAAMLFIVDPALDVAVLLKPVCKLFQLSNVESILAAQLATGRTLAEAATTLRVKEATARSYLKQVFAKTGTNRQAELVRILLSSVVRVSRQSHFEVV